MKQSKGVSSDVKTHSGPEPAVRAKAQAAKAAKQQQRIDHLRTVLFEIELNHTAQSLRPGELSHIFIRQQAGLSPATYWRYLKQDDALRQTATALVQPASQVRDHPGTPGQFLVPLGQESVRSAAMSLKAMLEAESAEKLRLAEINLTLQRQIAGAKALISLMDLDLAAKTREALSKDFLLSTERNHALKLTMKLKELAELCARHGITVDLELSTLVRPSTAGRPPPTGGTLPHLTIVESGSDEA